MRASLIEHRIIYEFQTKHSMMMQQDNQINTQRHMRKYFHKRIRCGKVRLDLPKGPQSTTRRSRDSSYFSGTLHPSSSSLSSRPQNINFFLKDCFLYLFDHLRTFLYHHFFLSHHTSLRPFVFFSFLGTRLHKVFFFLFLQP